MKRFAYGKVLYIDLTTGEYEVKPIEQEEIKRYLGGRGLNGKLLYDLISGKEDPLSPENPLIFGVGLLTGTPIPSSSRYTVTSLSPLTGGFGDGNSGGFFGPEMRFAGYSHIVITGRAKKPVYLYIEDDKVEIKSAVHLWGKDTWETDALIKEEMGDSELQIACIGPAGENMAKIACIINNLTRAIGRSGMGAVMGSKNLKAVAIRGSGKVRVASKEKVFKVLKDFRELIKSDMSFKLFSKYGTPGLVDVYNSRGVFPVKNFQESWLPDAESISGEVFIKKYAKKAKACYNCMVHCSHFYELKDSHKEEGLEFESIGALGPRIGITDYPTILKANHLCNRYGLDTIGAGDVIGFITEVFERGFVSKEEVEGLDLCWGNSELVPVLLKKISHREGIGDLLAEGSYRAALKIGRNTEYYAMHVKGQAIISADPRGLRGWGLGYAVASRGADHLRAYPVVEYCFTPEKAEEIWGIREAVDRTAYAGKGKLVKWCEDVRALADSLGICKFITRTAYLLPQQLNQLIEAITGVSFNADELMKIGERINNTEKLINIRRGFSRKDDALPERLKKEPIPEGPSAGMTIDITDILNEYYQERGWDLKTSHPTPQKLAELGLK